MISSIVRLHPMQMSSSVNLHKATHGEIKFIKLLFYPDRLFLLCIREAAIAAIVVSDSSLLDHKQT